MMSNIFEKVWVNMLNDVYHMGKYVTKEDANIKEILGNSYFIPSPFKDSPLQPNHSVFAESVRRGVYNIDDYPLKDNALYDYVITIIKFDMIYLDDDDGFVYTYPERLCNYQESFNQIRSMINRLKNNEGSNRAIATTLIPQRDFNREHIPCLQSLQALIRNNELTLSCFFRSNDLYGAFPSNMMFLTYLGLKMVDVLRKYYPTLRYRGIDYHSSSLHIYEIDIPFVEKILKKRNLYD